MVTKVVNTGGDSSSSALLAVVLLIVVLAVGFILYNQGVFGGNDADININLPDGRTVSGSVSQ